MRIIVADTETAHAEPGAGVAEVAWVEITPTMEVISTFNHRVDPEEPISPSASGVHRIVNADVASCPTLRELFDIASPIKSDEPVLFIAHNAKFDVDKLKSVMNIVQTVDTLTLARRAYKDAPDHKLTTLVYYLDLPKQTGASHAALVDCWDCFWLLRRLSEDLGMNLKQLVVESNTLRPTEKMAFGKHRGEMIKDIPIGYIKWLLKQPDLDPELELACKQRI